MMIPISGIEPSFINSAMTKFGIVNNHKDRVLPVTKVLEKISKLHHEHGPNTPIRPRFRVWRFYFITHPLPSRKPQSSSKTSGFRCQLSYEGVKLAVVHTSLPARVNRYRCHLFDHCRFSTTCQNIRSFCWCMHRRCSQPGCCSGKGWCRFRAKAWPIDAFQIEPHL